MNKYLLIRYCFLFLLMFSFESFAQIESVQITPDRKAIRIGEQIILDLTVQGQEGVEYLFPVNEDTLVKSIEILEKSVTDTLRGKDSLFYHQNWTLTSFDTGSYQIPALPFIIFRDSATIDTLASLPFTIDVTTVAVDTSQSFKPINDILEAPEYPKDYTWYYIIGAILLVVGVILYFIIRKSNRTDRSIQLDAKPKYVEPAHQYAFRELDQLKEKNLWQEGKFKQYHSELTEIIRSYLEKRFNINALEKTSDEIIQIVQNAGILSTEPLEKLTAILKLADMVKFAKKHPLPDENNRSMEQAMQLIELTKSVADNKTSDE